MLKAKFSFDAQFAGYAEQEVELPDYVAHGLLAQFLMEMNVPFDQNCTITIWGVNQDYPILPQ